MNATAPLRIFICYARSDNAAPHHWLDKVTRIIRLVNHADPVEVDSDQEIRPGRDWDDYIESSLGTADAVVLLVSLEFLSSRYVREHELPKVLMGFRERGLRILPVLVSPFPEQGMLVRYPDLVKGPDVFDLSTLQAAVGTPKRTLEDMLDSPAEWKRALNKLADEVGKIAREKQASQRSAAQTMDIIQAVPRPVWASAFDEDQYGVWADFQVDGVVQRCRWIKWGKFMMGSPEYEEGRWDDEGPQHEVTLSGYWLADTACTQALWQAVTGGNPSHFKGDTRLPVETVNWDDCRTFFDKLNARVPGLAAGFPTEAQWEYACRAGKGTPYFFGSDISVKQVNFGTNLGKTLPVASLPVNGFGLYEMHGNVWEWCADWKGPYAAELQTDPEGASRGSGRVLRGGSWLSDARDVRSASRLGYDPGYRSRYIGLRVAPGRAGPAEPA